MKWGFAKKEKFLGGGLVLLNAVEEALKAEKTLRAEGYEVKLVAPPPELRKGCDLAVEINLVERPGIERTLADRGVPYKEIAPTRGAGELLSIVHVTDFGESFMVKAGNMKLTFDKASGDILNISGGGCPDIPYLSLQLVGRKLSEAVRPKEIGFTLCSLMLDRAFAESLRIWNEGRGN